MDANPILGTAIFLLGGVAAATYLLPFRAVRTWRYETAWLVSVLAGWVAFPLAFDAVVLPTGLWAVLKQGDGLVFARSFGFGALWGVGALSWALMVRYLGVGLGLGIGAGLCAATGTLLPPLCTGRAATLVATPGARLVLAGVGVALVGIAAVGLAGRLKEGEMSEAAKKKAVAEFDFRKGLVAALVAGVASAGINFGLQGASVWERAAIAGGASPTWAGMPVLTVVLWGGVTTQVAWVGWKSWNGLNGFPSTARLFDPRHFFCLLLSSLSGVVGVMQFVLQKAGEPQMGDFRYASFAVLMTSAVFCSAILGVFLGEWRGTSRRTKACLAFGVLVLALGFAVMSLGGKPS